MFISAEVTFAGAAQFLMLETFFRNEWEYMGINKT